MNIVYNCDEKFAQHLAVSMTSLFEQNRLEKDISVYILSNGITPESQKKLTGIGDIYTVTGRMALQKAGSEVPPDYRRMVRIIELDNLEREVSLLFGDLPETGRFTVTALARILAPAYLPDGVERYLYLDCDTLIRGPLAMMYHTDLSGMVAGVVPEPTIYPGTRKKLGLADDMPYFNSGVMLIDRGAWERERTAVLCADFYREQGSKAEIPDQDMLNHALKGKIRLLPQRYDFFTNYNYRSYCSLTRLSPWYGRLVSADEYDSAGKNPVIVHFAGEERPWYAWNFNPYRYEYEHVLALTPWAKTPLEKGHERDMVLYHLMNLLTFVCPPARDFISSVYYDKKIKK